MKRTLSQRLAPSLGGASPRRCSAPPRSRHSASSPQCPQSSSVAAPFRDAKRVPQDYVGARTRRSSPGARSPRPRMVRPRPIRAILRAADAWRAVTLAIAEINAAGGVLRSAPPSSSPAGPTTPGAAAQPTPRDSSTRTSPRPHRIHRWCGYSPRRADRRQGPASPREPPLHGPERQPRGGALDVLLPPGRRCHRTTPRRCGRGCLGRFARRHARSDGPRLPHRRLGKLRRVCSAARSTSRGLPSSPPDDPPDETVASVLDAGPAAILVAAPALTAARIVVTLRDRGFGGTIVGSAPLSRLAFARAAGRSAEGVIVPLLREAGPAWASFASTWEQRFGSEPDETAAQTYDAVRLTASALARSGPNRALLLDALRTMPPWIGIMGVHDWDGLGRNRRARRAGRWEAGRVVPASTRNPRSTP